MSLAALALTLAAAAADPGSIAVGVYGPLTGNAAAGGISQLQGARLAADEINAAGGVLGKKLVVVEGDDEANPEKGAQLVKGMIERGVAAVLGPVNTGVANASLALANQHKVPLIVAVATGNKVNELFVESPDNYVFRLAASDLTQSALVVREAVEVRGFKRPALFCDDTPYGQQGKARIEAALDKRGLKPVSVGIFKVNDRDMSRQVKEAKAAGADVILSYGMGAEMAQVARALEKAAWKAPIIGSWQLSSAAFLEGAGPYGEGTLMPQTFIEAGATGRGAQFAEAYRKKYGVAHIPMGPAGAQGYDAMKLVALAIAQAKSAQGPQVKAALENLQAPYDGAIGRFVRPFSSNDHEGIKKAQIGWGVAKGGQVVPAR
ncbi:ABC transporter substrate-binding protein [Anaeromyxobacter diazotrophicus]|uniref:ABC transporter substrate-binding protein n=1 Tax=Anaeromyxobacter diazotrophicus TaxID=2590199 RepID=A0A7I9VH74_9BACT|nr:ABC transporter substrate-binding protein [Anaeromyxobacter diazotrophicus]GEJ55734.1 ABC transporter substrate-binding protein [Anaeromyxobacter diazotrophicus]